MAMEYDEFIKLEFNLIDVNEKFNGFKLVKAIKHIVHKEFEKLIKTIIMTYVVNVNKMFS